MLVIPSIHLIVLKASCVAKRIIREHQTDRNDMKTIASSLERVAKVRREDEEPLTETVCQMSLAKTQDVVSQ